MYYTNCINCGHVLFKGDKCKAVEMFCSKCGQKLLIVVADESVTVRIATNKKDNAKRLSQPE